FHARVIGSVEHVGLHSAAGNYSCFGRQFNYRCHDFLSAPSLTVGPLPPDGRATAVPLSGWSVSVANTQRNRSAPDRNRAWYPRSNGHICCSSHKLLPAADPVHHRFFAAALAAIRDANSSRVRLPLPTSAQSLPPWSWMGSLAAAL